MIFGALSLSAKAQANLIRRTPTMSDKLQTTQADRDAAAAVLGYQDWDDATDYRLSGRQDQERDAMVQAFARHRLQSASTPDEGLRSALERIIEATKYAENPYAREASGIARAALKLSPNDGERA